jgi:hypothetical protein
MTNLIEELKVLVLHLCCNCMHKYSYSQNRISSERLFSHFIGTHSFPSHRTPPSVSYESSSANWARISHRVSHGYGGHGAPYSNEEYSSPREPPRPKGAVMFFWLGERIALYGVISGHLIAYQIASETHF